MGAYPLLYFSSQLKAYDHDAVIAGYVLSQEGRKYNRVWYQVRQDCVLYKFRAHEVSDQKGGGENEGGKDTVYLIAGYQGVSFSTTSWLCSYISKCGKKIF